MENKADSMTRVPKKWLEYHETAEVATSVVAAIAFGESLDDAIWVAHLPHNLCNNRILFLAGQTDCNLSRQ